jgi:hypothetical protein
VPEDLTLNLAGSAGPAALSPGGLSVRVNGQDAGAVPIAAGWSEAPLALPARLWRRELNDLVLAPTGGAVCVGVLEFERAAAAGPGPAGAGGTP